MADDDHELVLLEDGWRRVYRDGILKLQRIILGGGTGVSSGGNDEAKTGGGNEFTNSEYSELYTLIYQMCIQKKPHCYTAELYDRFSSTVSDFLKQNAVPALRDKHGSFLLAEFVRQWQNHVLHAKWLCNFFRYLNRFHVKRYNKTRLENVATLAFRQIVFDTSVVNVTAALLDQIECDRDGESVDRTMLRDAIQVYVEMGIGNTVVYVDKFETHFLSATQQYYRRECGRWLSSFTVPQHLIQAQDRQEQERLRLREYLHEKCTEAKLMRVLFTSLLGEPQRQLFESPTSGIRVMLEEHSLSDLSRLFALYSYEAESLPPIADVLKSHVAKVGSEMIDKAQSDEKESQVYIEELIKLHDKYSTMTRQCFKNHTVFNRALTDVFQQLVNRSSIDTSDLLSVYMDRMLSQSAGVRLDEKARQGVLAKCVSIFAYMFSKDVFNTHYRKRLAKRLLLQKSVSDDLEKFVIMQFKVRVGHQFTSKVEGMMNDMRLASEHSRGLRQYARNHSDVSESPYEFSVQVLTTGYWPPYGSEEIKMSPVFEAGVQLFRRYYDSITNHRVLKYIHHLGVVTLTGGFERKKLDLVLSTLHANLLLVFNDVDELTIDELTQRTGMTPESVKKVLRALVSGRAKVLLKTPAQGYNTSHKIRVNWSYTNSMRRVRISNVTTRSSKAADRKAAQHAVIEDRKHVIESRIVRIMKTRKTLKHAQLMSEVSQQLMSLFRPQPKQIKQIIEDLISRDYLERDENDNDVFHYLA